MNVFEKFDNMTDLASLQNDIKEAESGTTKEFEALPDGTYEVSLAKIELKESKNGKPMVAMRFKILEGKYANQLMFVNQVISSGFGVHKCNELLKKMCEFVPSIVVEFKSYTQYNDLLNNIFDEVEKSYSYAIKQSTNKKNDQYKDYEIVEVFEEETPF